MDIKSEDDVLSRSQASWRRGKDAKKLWRFVLCCLRPSVPRAAAVITSAESV